MQSCTARRALVSNLRVHRVVRGLWSTWVGSAGQREEFPERDSVRPDVRLCREYSVPDGL